MNAKKLSDIELVEKSLNQLKEEYVEWNHYIFTQFACILRFHFPFREKKLSSADNSKPKESEGKWKMMFPKEE